jgi:hypothetical protein
MMQAEGGSEVCGNVTLQVERAAQMLVQLNEASNGDWVGAIWGYNNGTKFASKWPEFNGDRVQARAWAEEHYCSSAARRERRAPDGSGRSWCVWRADVAAKYISLDPNVRSVLGRWELYKQQYPGGEIVSFAGFSGSDADGSYVNTSRGPICMTTIRAGIKVACRIGPQVQALIDSAAAQGLSLTGGGWRSYESQVTMFAQRYTTAPVSNSTRTWNGVKYYLKPGNAPLAAPGKSMHEIGEAIDFNCNGDLIVSKTSPCFTFLTQHAASFGLQNYPVEAWHWSTNGN